MEQGTTSCMRGHSGFSARAPWSFLSQPQPWEPSQTHTKHCDRCSPDSFMPPVVSGRLPHSTPLLIEPLLVPILLFPHFPVSIVTRNNPVYLQRVAQQGQAGECMGQLRGCGRTKDQRQRTKSKSRWAAGGPAACQPAWLLYSASWRAGRVRTPAGRVRTRARTRVGGARRAHNPGAALHGGDVRGRRHRPQAAGRLPPAFGGKEQGRQV